MPQRILRNSLALRAITSWPKMLIFPLVGSTSRLIQRISVDLPAPEGPIIAQKSFSLTWKLTSRNI